MAQWLTRKYFCVFKHMRKLAGAIISYPWLWFKYVIAYHGFQVNHCV